MSLINSKRNLIYVVHKQRTDEAQEPAALPKCAREPYMRTHCQGITKKGLPCKLPPMKGEQYCRHHIHQKSCVKEEPVKPIEGFIYIYTYTDLYENLIVNKKERKPIPWLGSDLSKLPNGSKSNKASGTSNRVQSWPHRSDDILIKIGMTCRTDVSTRINEWKHQCKREIRLLTPAVVHRLTSSADEPSKPKKLSKFRALVWKLGRMATSDVTMVETRALKTPATAVLAPAASSFGESAFRCTNPGHVERKIHQWLWKEYGRGNVLCSACHMTHKEWVKAPVAHLDYIVNTVDRMCLESTTGLGHGVCMQAKQ